MSEYVPTPGTWRPEIREGQPELEYSDHADWGYAEVVTDESAILRADRGYPDDVANVRLAAQAKNMHHLLILMALALRRHDPNHPTLSDFTAIEDAINGEY